MNDTSQLSNALFALTEAKMLFDRLRGFEQAIPTHPLHSEWKSQLEERARLLANAEKDFHHAVMCAAHPPVRMNARKALVPAELMFLLHCHCILTVYPQFDAPVTQRTITRFLRDGIIKPVRVTAANEVVDDPPEPAPDREESAYSMRSMERLTPRLYGTTDKGKAWVEQMLRTACP